MISFKRFFPLPSEAQVELFEKNTGIKLPARYRDFLLSTNGGQPSSRVRFAIPILKEMVMLGALYGISSQKESSVDLEKVYLDLGHVFPSGFIPIGADPGGNSLLLRTTGNDKEGIFFWDWIGFFESRTGRRLFQVSENVDVFLDTLEP
jgi:hypothetical protein